MEIFRKIYQQAKKDLRTIVLPEAEEPRIIAACARIKKEKLARIILLGKSRIILSRAKKHKLNISGIEIVDPRRDIRLTEYINLFYHLRKHRGITLERAGELFNHNFVYFAAMMLRAGRADGFVAGVSHTTPDVARAALRCLKRRPEYSVASGAFLVQIRDRRFGQDGLFLFADCAIVPNPTAQQLAEIALSSGELWRKLTGYRPRLALLSFSSHGSGRTPEVAKVKSATKLIKKTKPDLVVDGELQVDSAVVPQVAKIKVPQSPLGGRANILIFPALDAGNIAYKLMQRLAGARMVGPLLQGLSKPCSDLSRGAGVQEIVDTVATTAVLAK